MYTIQMDLYFLYLAKKRSLDYRLPPHHLYFLSFAWMVVVHKLGQIMKTEVGGQQQMIDDCSHAHPIVWHDDNAKNPMSYPENSYTARVRMV